MIESHTATTPYAPGDDMSFDSYCIVCDRIIVPPKEPESEAVKMVKKKSAAGTIRVSKRVPTAVWDRLMIDPAR